MTRIGLGFGRRAWVMAALAGALLGAAATAEAQTVKTPSGLFPAAAYQGATANGVTSFLGIRYAASPTGASRFAPPAAPAAVAGTQSATSFGSACPQTPGPFSSPSANEDCLFLNVYAPAGAQSNSPVMVFFHGGAFVAGAGSQYDPSQLAAQGNTIVVTINYRLGILGYLADAALSNQAANKVSGNYGLEDQQFALQWVHQNISAFGGNARNVTIFGESAGGFSVCANVVSPKASGLFERAITESGPCSSPLPTLAAAQAEGAAIVQALGCNDATAAATVACLRGLSVNQILAEQNTITAQLSLASLAAFFPNVDGVVIPREPVLAIALGQYNHVPVIEGTNHDEGRLFVALGFDLNPAVGPLTAANYPAAVAAIASAAVTAGQASIAQLTGGSSSPTPNQQLVAQITREIINEYPLSDFPSPDLALSAILTDSVFACPANVADELFSLQTPTFGYEFNDENAPMLFLPPVTFPYGATHTDELQFLFAINQLPSRLNANEQTLARTMKGYWTSFARNGNPNSAATPFWSQFALLADNLQSLTPPTPQAEFGFAHDHKCNFWIGILLQTALQSAASQITGAGITQ